MLYCKSILKFCRINRYWLYYNSRFYCDRRKNEKFIKELLLKDSTEYILYNRSHPIVTRNCINKKIFDLVNISNKQYKEISSLDGIKIFLGMDAPQFGISLSNIGKEELLAELRNKFNINGHYLNNLSDYFRLSQNGIWSKLSGLYAWHYNNLFCGICGSETYSSESGYKRICKNSNCHSKKNSTKTSLTNYPRIDPIVAILPVTEKDPKNGLPACLLARKEVFPPKLMSCITGFLDPGESAEIAAIRELKEELHLDCNNLIYQLSEYWPLQSSLFLGYTAQVPLSTHFHLDEELSLAHWFNVDKVKLLLENKHLEYFIPPPSTIMYRLINNWYIKTMN